MTPSSQSSSMADYDEDAAAAAPSFSNYEDDIAHYDTVSIELAIKKISICLKTLVK